MDLKNLNEKQREAVTAPLGPVLVLAGAGSGKTRVLTMRVAYIIEEGLIEGGRILALTFTNKAAKEMATRVEVLLKKSSAKNSGTPTLGTFHSVFARVLRKEIARLGYSSSFSIFDTDDQLKVIREIADELNLGKRFPPTLLRNYISSAKNLVQTPAEFNLGLESAISEVIREVYTRYQNFLFSQNALDFDDLLLLPIKLFQNFHEVLKKYQELFSYILVDEYQDTNVAQYELLQLLANHHNLFVVGDDAQSIYGFRGSNIGNILSFEKDFPECKVIKLEQNYRSTKNILAVASGVISINSEQKPKTLWTENEAGSKVRVKQLNNEREEAQFIAKTIVTLASGEEDDLEYQVEEQQPKTFSILDQFLKKAGSRNNLFYVPQLPKKHLPLREFVVLYRTHAQSRQFEQIFMEAGIPYQIVGGVKFYERKEIKDMLAYLRLVANYHDLVSLKRVINVPARGFGEKSYLTLKNFIQTMGGGNGTSLADFRLRLSDIELPPKQFNAVKNFFWLIEEFTLLESSETLLSLMRLVFKKTNMEEWLQDGTEMGEMRVENVKELFTVAAKYNKASWKESLTEFLEEVALIMDQDTLRDEKDLVTLMTLHSAKGLEFDTVFFAGLEEGILPHNRSLLDPSELAEEIRLAYVGLTRAKKRLYLLYTYSRSLFGNTQLSSPSRIFSAMPFENTEGLAQARKQAEEELSYEPFE